MHIVDTKKATVSSLGIRFIQCRTISPLGYNNIRKNNIHETFNLLDDVFLVSDFIMSANVGILQGFCFSPKERLYNVLLLLVKSHASYASLLAYLTCQIGVNNAVRTL